MLHKLFPLTIILSVAGGIFGLITNQMVIFIPYALINPSLMIAFASLRKIKFIENITLPSWQEKIKLLGIITVLINLPGSLYLHRIGIQYDIPLHIANSFLVFLAFALIYPIIFYATKQRIPSKKTILLTAIIAIAIGGLAFEGFQKLTDIIFGTHLFFDAVQSISEDFKTDLLMDLIGTAAGYLYIKRRMPENLTTPLS
ncbi:MAG: hypothetical protein AAB454_00140 [Patescibacteria group bacterium]